MKTKCGLILTVLKKFGSRLKEKKSPDAGKKIKIPNLAFFII
jgi:hypothetical protein